MNTVSIRKATSEDIRALAALWQEKRTLLQQSDRRFRIAADARRQWELSAQNWLCDQRCAIYVAEKETTLHGFIVGWLPAGIPALSPEMPGLITELVIDAHTYQGGLGRMLLQALREWFHAHGMERMAVFAPHNAPVEQAFWRALGAVEWVDLMWIR